MRAANAATPSVAACTQAWVRAWRLWPSRSTRKIITGTRRQRGQYVWSAHQCSLSCSRPARVNECFTAASVVRGCARSAAKPGQRGCCARRRRPPMGSVAGATDHSINRAIKCFVRSLSPSLVGRRLRCGQRGLRVREKECQTAQECVQLAVELHTPLYLYLCLTFRRCNRF